MYKSYVGEYSVASLIMSPSEMHLWPPFLMSQPSKSINAAQFRAPEGKCSGKEHELMEKHLYYFIALVIEP
jgi:hypothetical protein